jgi:hypothetical protein
MDDLEYDETFPETVNLQSFSDFEYSHVEVSERIYIGGDVDESPHEWISAELDYTISIDEIR